MSSGESTNVLANAVGRIDFRAKRPQFDFPDTTGWWFICWVVLSNIWTTGASAAWPCFMYLYQKKQTTTTTQRTQTTQKQGFKDKCVFQLLATYTTFCSSNQLHRGRRKYYCLKIFCNQFIQIKVYRVYCAHNVSLENVRNYCMPNKLWERKLLHKKGNNYIVSYLMWIIIL